MKLGRGKQWSCQIKVTFPILHYLLLHDHDHLGDRFVGGQASDQLWVVKLVHDFDLFASGRSFLGGSGSVELPCNLLTRVFVEHPEHLAKHPPRKVQSKSTTTWPHFQKPVINSLIYNRHTLPFKSLGSPRQFCVFYEKSHFYLSNEYKI